MCHRYTLTHTATELAARFTVAQIFDPARLLDPAETSFAPRPALFPREAVPVISPLETPIGVERLLEPMQWGLVPFWVASLADGAAFFNVRDDQLREAVLKRTRSGFVASFRRRRCLIPASGFTLWAPDDSADPKRPRKTALHFAPSDAPLFAFAGLYDEWHSPDGSELRSCAIVTTSANERIAPISDRMPLILHRADESAWLTNPVERAPELLALFRPYPADQLIVVPAGATLTPPPKSVI